MKWKFILLLGLCAFVAASEEDLEMPDVFDYEDGDMEFLNEVEDTETKNDRIRENEIASKIAEYDVNLAEQLLPEPNPCDKMHCGAGRVCSKLGLKKAECICIPECEQITDKRRHVCTNKNETWNSDCAVYQQRCFCDTNDTRCQSKTFKHMHIDYYGECKSVGVCEGEEMRDFPARMRDWLFNIMRDLAERNELTEHYKEMQREAEKDDALRWVNAAVWKWCDLDGNADRSVSRHELFPVRAPLVTLEHCIAPFLEKCDSNNDHRISLKEWARCLELEDTDLNERCDSIQKQNPHLLG